jgi:uncharacterized protein (DUF2336 family)
MNAQLSFIDEIESTIAHSSDRRRAEMMRRLADLFLVNVDQYSDDEVALIDDVFVRLVATIEESARALLAIRLGPNSKAPPKILKLLASDDAIDVASPILIHAERLDDSTLIECARTKSQEHLLSISRRKTLAEGLTDILVERGDQQVILSTVQNAGAKFSSNGFAILVDRSHGDDLLTTKVGIRPDLPLPLFERLIEVASDAARAKLETETPHARHNIHRVVNNVAAQIRAKAANQPPKYAAAQVLVESLQQAGQLNAEKLEAFANAGRFEEVVAALAVMAKMPTDVVERKVNDDSAEFLLILAKANGLSWPATKSILALTARHDRHLANDAEECHKAFLRLNQPTAQQILGFHRIRESSTANRLM